MNHPGQQGYVPDVHARSAKGFLTEDYRESNRYGQPQQGNVGWHDKGNEGTGNQETLL